jgi:3-dehydroquinate synthase
MLDDGLLGKLPEILPDTCPASSYVVISDSVVAPLYAEQLAKRVAETAPTHLLTFPAGERHKTRKTWSTLTDQMLAAGVGRDGAVIAVGGGVVGDMAGFVAATYLRGIPCVQVPTTLLAMIDSSIGGKTGVDTRAGKNLVGAFHQPKFVAGDVASLETLPPNQFAAGMAEGIKHGAIADSAYLTRIVEQHSQIVARDPDAVISLVARSIEIKVAVVTEDERETGRRAVLNFGHTVGHAVEAASGYSLLHGEAIAIGMAVEADLGTSLGVTEADTADVLRSALELFRLPVSVPSDAKVEAILAAMRYDKKTRDDAIRFALLRRPGEIARPGDGSWTHQVDEIDIGASLERSF